MGLDVGWLSPFSFNGEAWGISLRVEAVFQIRMRGFWRISGDRIEQFTGTLSRNWQKGQRLYKNGHLVKETSVPPPNLASCLCVPSARAKAPLSSVASNPAVLPDEGHRQNTGVIFTIHPWKPFL